jgi:DNA modification methylase
MIIEKKQIADLIPAPYNPRQSTAKQEKHLKESLEKFGLVEPIIFNKQTGYIVGGHFRVRELKKLGIKEIECVIVDLNEDDEKELNIRLNANTGSWDWDTLANDWEVVDLEAWGLEIPQFDNEDEELEASEDDYEIPEGGIETDIVIGDLFEIGEHRLLCGDSTDSDVVARLMNGEKADMVFTDPPYGYKYESNYQDKHKELLNDDKILNFLPNAFLFTKDNTAFYVFCGWQTVKQWISEIENIGLNLKNIIVWKKNNWSMGDLKGAYAGQYEIILFAHKGRIELKEGRGQDVWEFDRVPPKEHPTMKPVELIIKALKDVSNIKNLVLDAFLGSGSTMVAAHQLKRRCFGMELEPKYCQVIIDRMKKLDSTLIVKRNGVEVITT